MTTRILPITDLRRNTSQIVQAVQEDGETVYITHHGRAAVVIVGYEQYQALLAELEDLSDLAAMEQTANDTTRNYDEFLEEMGLQNSSAGE